MSDSDQEMTAPGLKGRSEIREPSRAERSVGRRAAEVRATVPDLTLSMDADAGPALAAPGGSFTAALVAACAVALREHTRVNAAYRDGRYELYSRVNIAVTLDGADGVVAPVLLDADTKSLTDLDAELTGLREDAQAGRLRSPQLAGATFTLTDCGPDGPHRLTPLIATPQAAALAAGAVRAVPVVRESAVVPGQLVTLTLACDSRILLGSEPAAFLAAVVAALEAPPG